MNAGKSPVALCGTTSGNDLAVMTVFEFRVGRKMHQRQANSMVSRLFCQPGVAHIPPNGLKNRGFSETFGLLPNNSWISLERIAYE
ncbi:MAG: hypothetical protein K1Y36_14635 [Blastocatellia bacterium]|nr:hypothetical protein [Blastocatellia bacterium]